MDEPQQVSPSPGLLVAAVADRAVVFDTVTETGHVVDAFAAWLCTLEAPTPVDALASECSEVAGLDPGAARAAVLEAAGALPERGLVDRDDPAPEPEPVVMTIRVPEPGWAVGAVHRFLDRHVVFCGPHPDQIAAVDAFLGAAPLAVTDPADTGSSHPDDSTGVVTFLGVVPTDTGEIDLLDDSWCRFPTLDRLLWQLPGALNYLITRTDSMPVLHAGAVRTPGGRIVVVTGPIDAGKSTLIAALIHAGCDYLSDESVGIDPVSRHAVGYPKPLTLDATSQRLVDLDSPSSFGDPAEHRRASEIRSDATRLGGVVRPIDLVVHTAFDPGTSPESERLAPVDAAKTLLINCLNPVRAGQAGLEALCGLAEATPVFRIVHDDSVALAARLVAADAQPGERIATEGLFL